MSDTKTKPTSCHKVTVLTGATVVIEPTYNSIYAGWHNVERGAQMLESWAKELHDFFRDHRSMDVNSVHVEREHEDQCSACKKPWETAEEEGVTFCAWCGVEVEEAK